VVWLRSGVSPLGCTASLQFDTVVADLPKNSEDRVTGSSRSKWRQKVRGQGRLMGTRNDVRPAALTPQGKVLASLSVPNNWVFRRRNKRLVGPQALYFCPSFDTIHARGGRQARGSTERLTTGVWCAQESCHSPGEVGISAGVGIQKGAPSGHENRSRSARAASLLVKRTRFQGFSIGNLDWNSRVHVPNRAILERETGSNPKSNPFKVV
jgi:hypothetical protein